MNAKLFHQMNTVELKDKLKDMKTELFNLRFQHATGQLTNPLAIHNVKKDIARAMTIVKEREAAAAKAKTQEVK